MALDVGSLAINRDASGDPGTTYLDFANPAEESGIIDTVSIWAAVAMTGCKVGIFYNTGGNDYKCRSAVTIGAVTPAGSKQTFSGLSLAIVAGDFIGLYWSGGKIEYGTAGVGRGWWAGDHVNVDEEGTFGVAMGSGSFSCYGESTVGPPEVTSTRATASYIAVTGVGNITNKGGYTITKRGVAYNDTGGDPDPTVDDKVEEEGDFELGEFTEGITGLLPNTTYYVRPYAYSVEEGYGYGTTMTVTTSPKGKVIATLNSRLFGYPADVSFGAMRGGAWVHVYAPVDTNPDNLFGVDDTQTASPWLFRSFAYFDLRGLSARFHAVNLVVWSYNIGAGFEELHVIEGVQDFEIPTVANWIAQNSISTKLGGKTQLSGIPTGQYVKVPLNSAGVAFVKGKVGGYCKLCLMTKDDFENNYSVVVHNGLWHFYLPHESGKEPYLEFLPLPNFENLADPLTKSNFI